MIPMMGGPVDHGVGHFCVQIIENGYVIKYLKHEKIKMKKMPGILGADHLEPWQRDAMAAEGDDMIDQVEQVQVYCIDPEALHAEMAIAHKQYEIIRRLNREE